MRRALLAGAGGHPSEDLWDKLLAREPVCLVTRLAGDDVLDTALFDAATISGAGRDRGPTLRRADERDGRATVTVVTVFWSVPQLVVVGPGAVAEALAKAAALLGWQTQIVNDVATATGVIAGLAASDIS